MKGRFNPSQPFIHPSLLPFPRLFIALPKCLHSYCHEDVSRLSSLWQSLCLYLTEQSHIASVCLWRVVKGYEGLEKLFICLNYWYTTYYNQSMKSERLTCVSFEAGQKRMKQGAWASRRKPSANPRDHFNHTSFSWLHFASSVKVEGCSLLCCIF